MDFLKLWCAGKLGNCPKNLHRIRFTCLYCRWRREYNGKYVDPPFWIDYTLTWYVKRFRINPSGRVFMRTTTYTIKIDPRGHLVNLRCYAIVTLTKIVSRFKRHDKIRKILLNFCELFASITV